MAGRNGGRDPRLLWLAAGAALLAAVLGSDGTTAAGKAAAPRLNAYFASEFKDSAYQKAAFDRVLKAWKPKGPLPTVGKKAVLISTIGRDGKLTGLRLHLQTGDAAFDKACAEAVRTAGPFPALPASWPHAELEVHWHFEVAAP